MTSQVLRDGTKRLWKEFQSPHRRQPQRVSFTGSEDKDGATFRGSGTARPTGAGRARWETGRTWHPHLKDTEVEVCQFAPSIYLDSVKFAVGLREEKKSLSSVQLSSIKLKAAFGVWSVILYPICVAITLNAPPFVNALHLKSPTAWIPGSVKSSRQMGLDWAIRDRENHGRGFLESSRSITEP